MSTQSPYDVSCLDKYRHFQLTFSQMPTIYSKVKCCAIRSSLLERKEGDSSYASWHFYLCLKNSQKNVHRPFKLQAYLHFWTGTHSEKLHPGVQTLLRWVCRSTDKHCLGGCLTLRVRDLCHTCFRSAFSCVFVFASCASNFIIKSNHDLH